MKFLVPFLVAIGAGAWIFNKMYRRTGGNTTNALIIAGASGFIIFLVVLLFALKFLH